MVRNNNTKIVGVLAVVAVIILISNGFFGSLFQVTNAVSSSFTYVWQASSGRVKCPTDSSCFESEPLTFSPELFSGDMRFSVSRDGLDADNINMSFNGEVMPLPSEGVTVELDEFISVTASGVGGLRQRNTIITESTSITFTFVVDDSILTTDFTAPSCVVNEPCSASVEFFNNADYALRGRLSVRVRPIGFFTREIFFDKDAVLEPGENSVEFELPTEQFGLAEVIVRPRLVFVSAEVERVVSQGLPAEFDYSVGVTADEESTGTSDDTVQTPVFGDLLEDNFFTTRNVIIGIVLIVLVVFVLNSTKKRRRG